jgi:hypothetical protein
MNTYKPLKTDFIKKGFQFNQLYREGDVALFHKVGLKGNIHTKTFDGGFEVILVGRHEEYELGGVKIEAAETAPGDEQWGSRGWTFTNLYSAELKFEELKTGKKPVELEDEEEKDSVAVVAPSEPSKHKGRPKLERPVLNYPTGEFSVKDLADFNKVEYPTAFLFVKEQEAQNLIVRTRTERRAPKGPETQLFQVKTS